MSLDVLLAHEGARAAVLAALQLPAPLGKLLVQYLAMFRPRKRQLSWERVSSLLEELRGPIAAAQIQRSGRDHAAPLEYWKEALEHMVQLRDHGKLQLPLKSHGYLLEVIAGRSEKAGAKAENARDAARASGLRTSADVAMGNTGFQDEQVVEIVEGDRTYLGRIYYCGPTFASVEILDLAGERPTGKTKSVPYTQLRARPQ